MFCPKCGTQLPDGSSFCAKCGACVRAPQQQAADNAHATAPMAASTLPASMPTAASSAASPTTFAEGEGTAPKKKKALVAGFASAGVVLIAAALVGVVFLHPFSGAPGDSDDESGHKGALSTVTINGTTIESLARPVIATTVQSSSGMSATPALVNYRTYSTAAATGAQNVSGSQASPEQTATAGTSSNGQTAIGGSASGNSAGNSTSGSGDTSNNNPGGSSASSDAATDASENGSVTVQNAYGDIASITPASDLSNVTNLSDFSLTGAGSDSVRNALATNQFVVRPTNNSEFFDLYENNRYMKQASFITTDSIMHSYHLYFSYLLKTTEKNNLSSQLSTLSQTMLQASIAQQDKLVKTEWESAASRNVLFFSVGCRLLDPAAQTPIEVESAVTAELAKINAANGIEVCALTGTDEDYSQYKPRGYYEGDSQLESYFRAMMWYGRLNFTQNDDDLDRSALLITLALDGGNNGTVDSNWEAMYSVTSFFAGAADDQTYYEYYPLFSYAYGEGASVDSLAGNTAAWDTYHELTDKMPAPQINSLASEAADSTEDDTKGFRFMGQRFSIDEATFSQLVYDNVGTDETPRMLPAALDLPAALGSNEALDILKEEGETNYENYDTQMEAVRTNLANSDDSIWTASLYSQWLYTLNPLLAEKGEGYPAFMQSPLWNRKNLQSYLGSYTELKHDTVLYSKQEMTEMGGGIPNHDDRGYVEPEPELYARLANLTQATSDGLTGYGMLAQADADNLKLLKEMATRLQTMSEKELAGESLSTDEYDFIRTYGGQIEHFWTEVNKGQTNSSFSRSSEFPAAVVVDIATNGTAGTVLEEGTGKVSEIFVLVPIDGQLHLCRGATFSHYEFEQPIANRLTDTSWREMLGITGSHRTAAEMPQQPAWTQSFTVSRPN